MIPEAGTLSRVWYRTAPHPLAPSRLFFEECEMLSTGADIKRLIMVPEPGWTTKAKVVQVYDGDTIVVDVTRRFRVRILDCWAPEVRTKDDAAKQAGFESRDHLAKMLPVGSTCTVAIPSSVDGELQDVLTMGRFLAHVWSPDGVNVAEAQVKAGHATREKG